MDVRSRLCLLFLLSVSIFVSHQAEGNSTAVPTDASFITDFETATEMMTDSSTELGDSMTTSMPSTEANIPENSPSTLKATVTPIATTVNQTTMAPGTTSTTNSTTDMKKPETSVAPNTKQTTMAPGTTSTTKSTTDMKKPETSVAPDATKSPKSTEGIGSTKTSPTAAPPKHQSPRAPTDKVKPSSNHSYTGAIVGLFIFLVATGVLFVAIYLVRRRKLRNNYGRLDEDTEGDGGWSAFSKNPIYRGDKDYQPL